MNLKTSKARKAFTLIEMMVSLAIGMLLMVGLYMSLDMHFTGTEAGRAQADQAQVARSILKRLNTDIKNSLAVLDAYTPPTSASSNSAAATTVDPSTLPMPFNLGVVGDSTWLALYVSRVPRSAQFRLGADGSVLQHFQAEESDLRRITYWLVANGDGSGGMARQELKMVTSDDEIANMPPGIPDEQSMVFANEVVALSFEFFDGTTWQASWDGMALGPDGVTPLGPPLAIAVNISVARTDHFGAPIDDGTVRDFRHVIQIPTASHFANQVTTTGGSGTP